jgi:PAS domain S-box-containing protein
MGCRETVVLVLDSAGNIETVRIANDQQLRMACDALEGESLQQILGSEAYGLITDGFVQTGDLPRDGQVILLKTDSGPRKFSVFVTKLAQRDSNQNFPVLEDTAISPRALPKTLDKTPPLLAEAEKAAQVGAWAADLRTGELMISDHFLSTLGVGEPGSPLVSKLLWQLVQFCRSTEQGQKLEPVDLEVPYYHPDGNRRIFRARTIPLADRSNAPLRFIGTLYDVTEQKAAEQKLHESQSILAQAEQIANLGNWEFELATRKVTWSEQLYHLLGFCPWEPAAEQLYWDNLHPADRSRVRELTDRAIELCKEFSYTALYRLPTGEYRVHYTRGVPIRGGDGKTARVIGIVQDITEQTKVEADLHRLSHELLRTRDEERRHMARELHESAGQSLAALKMTLGNLREALPKKNSLANSLLQACVDLTNEAVKEVRTISYLMHPPMLDEAGLPSALRWYARGFTDRSKIQVEVEVSDDFGRQSQEIEMTVFRIVQEALTNVHRYSGSKTARICLERNCSHICVTIQDQGRGLPHPMRGNGSAQHAGVGIAGMRERVHQLKGVFEIESLPGQGTSVRVTLPIAAPAPHIANQAADRHGNHEEPVRFDLTNTRRTP